MEVNSNDGLPPVRIAHRSKSSSSGHVKKSVRRLTVAEVAKEHEIRKLQELIHDDELNIDPDMKTNGKLLVLLVILLAIVSFTLVIIITACWVRTAQKQTDTTETSKHTDLLETPIQKYEWSSRQKAKTLDASCMDTELDKPLFGLHFLAYCKYEKYSPVLDAYEEAIYHVGKLLGFQNATSARDEVKALVDLEIQMAKFRQENSSAIISSSTPIRLEDIHDNYSQILDLRNFLISLMTSPEVGVSDFNNNNTIIHLSRWYFQNLESLIPSTENRSLNYGSLGPLIGMCFIHCFDVTGLNLDEHGNRSPWWSARAADRYVINWKCLKDQLANYLVKEANMTAYRQWVLSRGEEAHLPAINFTHNQLFFLSYAQAQCGVYPLEKLKESLISNVTFILGEVRVNGPLPNVKAFSETFECPVGSPMNPIHRCNVW